MSISQQNPTLVNSFDRKPSSIEKFFRSLQKLFGFQFRACQKTVPKTMFVVAFFQCGRSFNHFSGNFGFSRLL